MDLKDLETLRKWFSGYCRTFYSANEEDQKNILLKEVHTFKVCENIVRIAKDENAAEDAVLIAEAIGLFHDVGRFPQYAEYKTFKDSISVNHGKLGADILIQEKALGMLPQREQNLIADAVRFHNAFSIPELDDPETIFFIKLARDADKLDIWRVFQEYYEASPEQRASAVSLGYPDIPEYSSDALASILDHKIISLARIRTMNDFRLLQLSWLYDLNFKTSFRIFMERDYIEKLSSPLPKTDQIRRALTELKEFAEKKMGETG